jgi:polyisoprenoid-binding protein YceI
VSTTTIQEVPTGAYTLDPVHSSFGFRVKHNGVSTFRGQFEQVEATLNDGVLDGTVQVESVKTAIPQLKEHLLAPDFFNAAEAPAITFRSTDIRLSEDGAVEVDGDLTLRGVSKPITAKGTLASGIGMSGSEVAGVDLEATIDRRDYGLNWQAPLPAGGNALAWDVTLQAHLELAKA